jgi:sRNA-binding carbon storage regulator CsrA
MSLLVIRLKGDGDRLRIGDVLITYRIRSGGQVEIAIDAPEDVPVIREEALSRVLRMSPRRD